MKRKGPQYEPYATFIVDAEIGGIKGDVRMENNCQKWVRKPRNWVVNAFVCFETESEIVEKEVRFTLARSMPTDFSEAMYVELNKQIAGRKWYFARVTCRPQLN